MELARGHDDSVFWPKDFQSQNENLDQLLEMRNKVIGFSDVSLVILTAKIQPK